ncbi:MAG: guanylate kinase [Clostridia bacterium]|nr:guanylate kinase [Clostridia bacterium]MBR0407100.1 guanylate kinase [Clostridia bacterium]
MKEERKCMLIVISGPSGVGKGTIFSRLLASDPSLTFSVSATTRAPRTGETDGVDYFFITDEQYQELVAQDAFLEHATVHGHSYGTLKSQIEEKLSKGLNVVLDIDPQGAKQVIAQWPECVSIFLLPPSYQKLRERLYGRNTDASEEIERRLKNAKGEIEQAGMYQYAVVNDDLQLALSQVSAIIAAEKQRTSRYFPVVE